MKERRITSTSRRETISGVMQNSRVCIRREGDLVLTREARQVSRLLMLDVFSVDLRITSYCHQIS
jgi:hypothetical protein